MSPALPASRRWPGDTAMASPSAITTTTAGPTCSSPDGGRMPSIETGATGHSRKRPSTAGLGGDRDWPTSAAFADLDGDGDLDLYVCHYMKWDDTIPAHCADPDDPTVYHCLPLDFEALPGPPVPQRRRAVRRRHLRGGDRRSGRAGAGRPCGRPRRRRADRPVRRQRHDRQLLVPQPRRAALRGGRRRSRAWPATPRAPTRRGWGSPAATSTATAGSTWPSRTTTTS